ISVEIGANLVFGVGLVGEFAPYKGWRRRKALLRTSKEKVHPRKRMISDVPELPIAWIVRVFPQGSRPQFIRAEVNGITKHINAGPKLLPNTVLQRAIHMEYLP